MEKVVKFMMQLIKSEVLGAPLDLSCLEKLTIEQYSILFELSKMQDLAQIVGSALIQNGLVKDQEILSLFNGEMLKAISRDERIKYESSKIYDLLEQLQIPFLPLKGAVIRELYPSSWMRNSCDIDIYVEKKNVETVVKILCKKYGYKLEGKFDNVYTIISPAGYLIELHTSLRSIWQTEVLELKNVPSICFSASDSKYHKLLSNELFYVYCISHTYKHFTSSGCGIRSFVDVLLMNAKLSIDKEKLQELLALNKLDKFYNGCQQLIDVWFYGNDYNELTKKMQKFVLNSGVYGDAKHNILLNYSISNGNKARQILKRLWVRYDAFSAMYPIVKKHRWLVPFCQIHRWLKLFTPKYLKKAINETKVVKNLSASDSQELQSMLNELK